MINLFHLSFHAVHPEYNQRLYDLDGISVEILDQPKVLPTFDFEYDKFAREFVSHFSASYEQDGSFAFFRKGDSISGQIGGDEKENMAFLELHSCRNPANLDRIVQLLPDSNSVAVQLMEAGVFFEPETYRKLLVEHSPPCR